MKLLITLTWLCIMAVAMNAQTLTGLPEHGVDLAGTPDSPYVANNSHKTSAPKTIVAYVLKKAHSDGSVSGDLTRFNPNDLPEGLPIEPGADDAVRTTDGHATRRVATTAVSIDLVLFSDGTTEGPDSLHVFDAAKRAFLMDKKALVASLLDLKGRKK